jgi:hypothetical protein
MERFLWEGAEMDRSNVRNSVGSLRKRVIFLALVLAFVGASVASPAVGSEQQGTGEQQEDALPQEGNGDVFTNVDEAARQSSNPLGGDFMVLLNQWYFDFQQWNSFADGTGSNPAPGVNLTNV